LANSSSKGPWYSTECKTISSFGGGCSSNGPWAIQYLPKSLGNYSVTSITKAAQVFKAMNCSSTKDQDAVACLAGQLLATKLNLANGSNTLSCPVIQQVVSDADAFLMSVNYVGPSGVYKLNPTQRSLAIKLKTALDSYNNNSCPVYP
jgi:hypothetical protein